MKIATAVATRTTVATNIAKAACEKTKNDFANAKELSKQKKTKWATAHETIAKV